MNNYRMFVDYLHHKITEGLPVLAFLESSSLKLTMRSETRHYFDTHNTSLTRSANNTKMAPRISADVWRIVLPGGAAFTFGFMLLVWSVLSSQLEWWNVGLAAMLTGQSALLIAAILLVQHVRHGNRDLSAKIDATIGGLHVLRKEKRSVCPTSPSPESSTHLFNDRNLEQRFAEVRKQIAKVQRSLAGMILAVTMVAAAVTAHTRNKEEWRTTIGRVIDCSIRGLGGV